MRFTRFALPDRPVHSDTNSASPGSILARQQLRAKTKSLTFPPLSITRYSFKQLSQLGPQWRERKCPIIETVAKGNSKPGSLDCLRVRRSTTELPRSTWYLCQTCSFQHKLEFSRELLATLQLPPAYFHHLLKSQIFVHTAVIGGVMERINYPSLKLLQDYCHVSSMHLLQF